MADVTQPPITLADMTPLPEGTTPTSGTQPLAARPDHVHQRLTSVTGHVLDANGEATVTFTQPFAPAAGPNPYPGISCFYTESADNTPVVSWKAKSWVTDGNGNYTACVIKAYRGRPLPIQTALSGSLLLGSLISGLNTILAGLSGYDITGGSAANVSFTCIAVKRSTATT